MCASHYDVARICMNGHVINWSFLGLTHSNQKFCSICGAPTITNCKDCDTGVRIPVPGTIGGPKPTAPRYCHECGKPYPWTDAILKAAREVIDDAPNLTDDERTEANEDLGDLVRDTPRAPVAANRFRRLVDKAGKPTLAAMRELFVDIASSTLNKSMRP